MCFDLVLIYGFQVGNNWFGLDFVCLALKFFTLGWHWSTNFEPQILVHKVLNTLCVDLDTLPFITRLIHK